MKLVWISMETEMSARVSIWIGVLCALTLTHLPAAERKVVFLGDSLTAGYGLSADQAFPALIQQKLQADGLAWRVINAGKSGDTTKGGLARVKWLLRSKPDVVVVALGANDGLRGLPVAKTKENLTSIGQHLRDAGAHVIYCGMTMPPNLGNDYVAEFTAMFPEVAQVMKAPLYPFLLMGVAAQPELNQADGIHPNAAGQEIIANLFYQFLKPELNKVSDGQSGG